jgi:CRISPR-associated protein Csm1
MMRFTSTIPSARAGDVIPDVSLYDHSRLTSALAAALYRFHRENQSLYIDAVRNYEPAKFLLIGADFYGIQDFIFTGYGDTRRYRSKLLRGRSFAVSLLMELAAEMVCGELGLPHVSVVLNAGGKLTLLAHNTTTAKQALTTAEDKINDWLIRNTYGETGIGFSSIAASPSDFVSGNFEGLWDRLGEAVAERKFTRIDLDRHGGVVTGYLDAFVNTLNRNLCPLCGKRPSSPLAEKSIYLGEIESACVLCRDHVFLGTNVVKKSQLAVTTKGDLPEGREAGLLEPLFGEYQVAFPDGELGELAARGKLIKLWDLLGAGNGVTVKYINGYVPLYGPEDQSDERILAGGKSENRKSALNDQIKLGDPKTLHHIAAKARHPAGTPGKFAGLEALAILKADVDHLGMLMSCGLKPDRFTISRLATLSREMNWFFALYLPDLLRTGPRFRDVYTVFAGGDDLFLIGPWNRIIELALVLRERFSEYVCHNPDVHFSAGIALVKPMTPLDVMAERAEQALQASKENRDSLTLFSRTVRWSDVENLVIIKETLESWLQKGWINSAMLYRLNELVQMAGEERRVVKGKEIYLDDLDCTRWRFLLAYTSGRNVAKDVRKTDFGKARENAVEEVMGKLNTWLSEYGEKLLIPLWTILYDNR